MGVIDGYSLEVLVKTEKRDAHSNVHCNDGIHRKHSFVLWHGRGLAYKPTFQQVAEQFRIASEELSFFQSQLFPFGLNIEPL